MIGALIGDIVGSVYEFDNVRSKQFPLFTEESFMTDDSIMTLAVAEIIQNKLYNDQDKVIDTLKKWGRAYPDRGYGGMFYKWLFTEQRESYNSFGNGSAMRISAVGWYGRSEEEVKELSKFVTEVTHSHPEGIKGAEVVAMCIYYARKGKTKEFIKNYVEQYYDLDFNYDDLVKNFKFNETCQETVPQAIYCFLISNSFEDCLRTTISIGGDCDTTSAISCAIAEAFYKDISEELLDKIYQYLPKASNGCNPGIILSKFLEYKISDSIMTEEITDNTCMICSINEYNGRILADWIYSKSIKALSEYLIFDEVDRYFGVEDDDLSKDLLKDRNIEGYVDCVGMCYGYKGQIYESLLVLKGELKSLLTSTPSFNDLKSFLDDLNNHLKLNGYKQQFICFDNPNDALRFLRTTFGISSEIYSEIFEKTYRLNKE